MMELPKLPVEVCDAKVYFLDGSQRVWEGVRFNGGDQSYVLSKPDYSATAHIPRRNVLYMELSNCRKA